jgi:hypothetical protein
MQHPEAYLELEVAHHVLVVPAGSQEEQVEIVEVQD